MIVYRITHKKWATSLQASGYPARWNSSGIFILYTAENMSLDCLENVVHRKGLGLNASFEVMHISIPNSLKMSELNVKKLPKGWDDLSEKGQLLCRKLGDDWVKRRESCVLKVPSVIIPSEFNILINTHHPHFSKIKLKDHHPFTFDNRLR